MKIKKLHFNQLRNNEHFQCQTEFKALLEGHTPMLIRLMPFFTDNYIPAYNAEDEALIKIVKNTHSDKRGDADRGRDQTFRGSADTVLAGLNHFDPDVQEAARRLKIVFDQFGNVAQLPLNEETSAIYNLVQEVTEKHATDAAKLGLMPWMSKLNADNQAYEALVTSSSEEEALKTEIKAKEARAEVDFRVRQFIERVEALMVVEGEAGYVEFVRRLNLIFERYANTLAQRRGIAKAKREKEEEEKKMKSENTDQTD